MTITELSCAGDITFELEKTELRDVKMPDEELVLLPSENGNECRMLGNPMA